MWYKRILMILMVVVVIITVSKTTFAQPITDTEPADVIVEITNLEEEEKEIEATVVEIEEVETEPIETEYVEQFPEVPHYFQTDYPDTSYGSGTVATQGCGIASLSMVLTYLLDQEILPDYLAEKYGYYNTGCGSSWDLFTDSAEDFGVTIEKQTYLWPDVVTALKNGQVIIVNANKESIFTDFGHFIVLDGITEDGKILVKDPYRENYSESRSPILKEGFANGFDEKYIKYSCYPYWIYAPKDLEAIAARAEALNLD